MMDEKQRELEAEEVRLEKEEEDRKKAEREQKAREDAEKAQAAAQKKAKGSQKSGGGRECREERKVLGRCNLRRQSSRKGNCGMGCCRPVSSITSNFSN